MIPGANNPSTPRRDAYFPKPEQLPQLRSGSSVVRSEIFELVYDKEKAAIPLKPFDEKDYAQNYTQGGPSSLVPPKPPGFSDPYLLPTLSRNERLRLTMLWYHTRKLTQDAALLLKLQERVNFVNDFIGWEYTMVGILDNSYYTAIAAANLALVIIPRREALCSHTIIQDPGCILMIDNAALDWRFRGAPNVVMRGLRSYAGTQLRCKTSTGEEVALGSLCVASAIAGRSLSEKEQAALVFFAEVLVEEVLDGFRRQRNQQKQIMNDVTQEIQKKLETTDGDEFEQFVLSSVKRIYEAHISIQSPQNDCVRLQNRPCLPLSQVHESLWEDSAYIDSILSTRNQAKIEPTQSVRAIVGKSTSVLVPRVLVVASNDIELIFDEVDAWFVEKCATMLNHFAQKQALTQALQIKETFLRGVTHQLRTPIHGVLGSSELLAEELKLLAFGEGLSSRQRETIAANAAPMLATIKSSGKELMLVVNNILRLNRITEMGSLAHRAVPCNFDELESTLYAEISLVTPLDELQAVHVIFENHCSSNENMLMIDTAVVQECLQAILLNAVQFTTNGIVTMITSVAPDYSSLKFDVMDTGCGIKLEDQTRIFQAYEKVDPYGRGAGLGLTLASKIATMLNGTVELISSEEGKGSHFRATFNEPALACQLRSGQIPVYDELAYLPTYLYLNPTWQTLMQPFADVLYHRGIATALQKEGSMLLTHYTDDFDELREDILSADPRQITLCLLPVGKSIKTLPGVSDLSRVVTFSTPLFSCALEELLKRISATYMRLSSAPSNPSVSCKKTVETGNTCLSDQKIYQGKRQVPPNALIVDDNEINIRIMRVYCDKRSIPNISAVNGHEAIDLFRANATTNPINLILMDLQMPECDGAQACEEIRAYEAETERQPSVIFMITGQDSVQDRSRSLKSGADAFFVKPLSMKNLDQAIERYFESSKPPN